MCQSTCRTPDTTIPQHHESGRTACVWREWVWGEFIGHFERRDSGKLKVLIKAFPATSAILKNDRFLQPQKRLEGRVFVAAGLPDGLDF